MMLEAAQYEDNAFCTLTYRDETLPTDMSVHPSVLSSMVKRLRKDVPVGLRYFGVGEYGDETGRPHYHLALFGFPACFYGRTRNHVPTCCTPCETIKKAWTFGRIEVGLLTPQSMAYVAGYINKKMTRDTDPRLEGRRPEFARMSLKPGIGLGMMHELASSLMEYGLDEMVDVPAVLAHGKVSYPLGRYLRRKLRTFIGRPANAPSAAIQSQKEKLQPLREAAFLASKPFKTAILEASLGKRIQIENRARIFKKRKVL